jgi:hypothetical protein
MTRIQEQFSPQRLALCLKRDMKPNSRSSFIVLGAAVGFLLIISALDAAVGQAEAGFHQGIFYPVLIVGGFVFVSGLFKEVYRKETNMTYLMLPASALEKVLSRLLLATVGWVLFTILWYSLYAALSEALNALLFGRSHALLNPLSTDVWVAAAHYSVMQSLFLLGAIYFRKLHFFKTVLTLTAATIVLSLFGMLLVRLVFADYFSGTLLMDGGAGLSRIFEHLTFTMTSLARKLAPVKNILYWVLFPLFCWTLVYIRFREVQIKDGV